MIRLSSSSQRWGVLWRSQNALDGDDRHLMWKRGQPLLFYTRREAREFIEKEYGYIRRREDLRSEPHGWRMPLAVRVTVTIEAHPYSPARQPTKEQRNE